MIKTLDDFKVYALAMELGEDVWNEVSKWNSFEKDTVGRQLVRASDSVAANLSEGLGRFHFKEAKNFSYYSRGSLFETKTWLTKAVNRNLISAVQFKGFQEKIDLIGRMLNSYINSIGNVQEPEPYYNHEFPMPEYPNAQCPMPNA
jgi:four helix bundle protein